MSLTSTKAAPRRRGGYRLIIVLLVVLLLAGAAFFWLNSAAQAAVNAAGTLTVFQPTASVTHTGGTFPGATGAVIEPGDTIKTDPKGRAALQLPDGTVMRMAGDTQIKLTSAHFAKSGNLHDVSILQKAGRTFTNVQHLIGGASFKVAGQSAVASVRGTKFEVVMNADGTMVVKLFDGLLHLEGKNTPVNLVAPQQATVDAQGNVGPAGPILPDPNDPFGPQIAASDQTSQGTTPGTEQDFIGAPIHNGEQQSYTYSFAGNGIVKAALGYTGSLMALRVKSPDGTVYSKQGPPPIVVLVPTAPAGIYTITVAGISGLGAAGEEPFVSVASLEPCATATVAQNGAVRHGYTPQDLAAAISVPGLSNLSLSFAGDSVAGGIITGTGTYNGVSWSGTVVLFWHGGVLEIFPVGASVFNVSVPATQIVQQIGGAIAQDPTNINPGYKVDRLFTCLGVLMIDGRVGA